MKNAIFILDTISLVLILVKLNQKLTGVNCCLRTAPLYEVLETLSIFQDCANSTQAKSFETLFAVFGEVKKNVDALDIKKVKL